MKQAELLPTIFTDRSLAKHSFPNGIRDLGFTVVTIWDQYGVPAADTLPDETWLADCGDLGWPALTMDFLRDKELRETILAHGSQVFRFERKLAHPTERVECFDHNQHRFLQRCQNRRGFFDVFRDDKIDDYWP